MLYVISGSNGSGKTLYAVEWVSSFEDFKGRPKYVSQINELDHEWFGSQELEDPTKWVDCPDGSVIVIDEAWEWFSGVGAFKKKPEHIEALAKHRHRGIDIVLITQDASDLDKFVRSRMWRHIVIHRYDGSERAMVYEWKDYQSSPHTKAAIRKRLSQKDWKFPKDIFERYKSAEIHTGRKTVIRWKYALWVLIPLGVLAACVFLYKLIFTFGESATGQDSVSAATGALTSEIRPFDASARRSNARGNEPITTEQFLVSMRPRVKDMPWTAPIYDDLTRPKDFPRPNCIRIESSGQCRCYTQQATDLDLTEASCNHYVDHGYFDYTREPSDSSSGIWPSSRGRDAGSNTLDAFVRGDRVDSGERMRPSSTR